MQESQFQPNPAAIQNKEERNGSVRVAIAHESIESACGLGHYVEDLDRALRIHAGLGQTLETPPPAFEAPIFSSQSQDLWRAKIRGHRLFILAKKSPLHGFYKKFISRGESQVKLQGHVWTEEWDRKAEDAVALLPHVGISDEGMLDDYYSSIARRPFVWVIHDLHALHYPDQWREADLRLLRTRFAFLASRAKKIVVHNEFTAQDVSEKLGVDRARISVVLLPPFFHAEAFASDPESDQKTLAELGIQTRYAIWGSSSTLSHKNHENLLKAWRILANRGHSVQLVCTGSRNPRWRVVDDLIKRLKLSSMVRFTGQISDEALATVLRHAHLAVCPTLFEGGGPGPAVEAVLSGIPLTLSSIPQCRQLFNMRDDLCSFFDPQDPSAIADSVEQILLHYDKARQRAQFARQEYPTLRSWKDAAKRYWEAIESAAHE